MDNKQFIWAHSIDVALDGMTLDKTILLIRELIKTCGGNGVIKFNRDYESDTRFRIYFERKETDDEFNIRVRCAAYDTEKRHKQYLELKKEFEND